MTGKRNLNSMKKGYFKIPFKLIQMDLPAYSLSIYLFLASQIEEKNPSIRDIANKLQISPATAFNYLNILLKYNIIRVIEKGGLGRNSHYAFVNPKEWRQ